MIDRPDQAGNERLYRLKVEGMRNRRSAFHRITPSRFFLRTGLLQKAQQCIVFSVQFSEKDVFYAEYCLLKTENLDFAKVLLEAAHELGKGIKM